MKRRIPAEQQRAWMPALHRWYALVWVVLGLAPSVIGGLNDPAPQRYTALALLVVTGLGYAVVRCLPGNPVVRPTAYLCLLAGTVSAMAWLPGGGASLFIVSLPQFWILAASPRAAVVLSGAAAAGTVVGSVEWAGPWSEAVTGNTVFALIGYAAGVLVGTLLHRSAEEAAARALRLSTELESAQSELAEAHRRQGAVEERERLAREIHDTLAQGFASIIVLAEAARSTLGSEPERTARQLLSIEQTARENFAEARVLVGSAPQSGLTPGPVGTTLRRTLDRFAEDTGITVLAELPELTCDQQTRIALLRCTQESLANVRKHAGASTVSVFLDRQEDRIELEITDDGRGFVVERSRGFGLDGMRRRLAELGGELTVTSSPGDGTRVLAALPTNGQE
ncbi:sensor histidine kinase [Streptomyces sp. NPDC127584]|uniref:sensor histidine kinase n=1 Tax=Streptomyces sp. NPDC127584 TaxID=3345403 RepID=UPI00363DB6F8